jgi:asparagine synthase (glutamine-hydrolysing)
MCGFVGIIAINEVQPLTQNLLDPAIEALAARGPDSVGYYQHSQESFSFILAHRRLKIIDLSDAANQPFCLDNLVMAFNGEIYNYLELRLELEALGCKFSTSSDTEVLLRAYQYWGNDCFARLEGAFAIAIYNKSENKVILSRDRFGEKPLYYSKQYKRLCFGSTLDTLSDTVCSAENPVDLVSLRNFLVLGYVCAPETARAGINKLKPGQVLSFTLPNLEKTEYFFGFNQGHFALNQGAENFDIEVFETLLVSSLSKRFRADLPVVLLLSGGIDSTYLACLAKRVLKLDFRAITITDDLDESEETRRAQEVCKILEIPHTLVKMNVDKLNQQARVFLAKTDEVSGDPAFSVLCELFAATPKNAVVFLTGDGSDELFLSYSSYVKFLSHNKVRVYKIFEHMFSLFSEWVPRFLFIRCLPMIASDAGARLKLTLRTEFSRYGMAGDIPKNINDLPDGIGALYQYSIENELPEYLLYKTDRASMMHSKETRAPFLDTALFNYMLACKWGGTNLGNKNAIIRRINFYLGSDIKFVKRGMAAGGQKKYDISLSEILSTARMLVKGIGISNKFKFYIQLITNPMARFRILAIHSWISKS